jgi:hypothetical protein
MYIRPLAVASLTFLLCVMASAGAEEVKIMGLTNTNAVLSDSKRPLAYLTGSCQKKQGHMKCHLNEIEVRKLDTTPFEEKAKKVMDHIKNNPQNVESFIESHMPYLCQEYTIGEDRMDGTSQNDTLSPGEKELRQATRQFCAEKSEDNLRAVFDLRVKMQARTCALWVNSYARDFTLRGKEWVSTQGPYGSCGFVDTAVFSSSLYNSQGQEIRFNRYRTRQIVTKKNAPLCSAGEDQEYIFVLEKPRYADCVYIDFSPWTFGWSLWQPRSP